MFARHLRTVAIVTSLLPWAIPAWAQAAAPEPDFEEMAVPAPALAGMTPFALTPRNIDPGARPLPATAAYRVAPRSAAVQVRSDPTLNPLPIKASVPAAAALAPVIARPAPEVSAAPLGGRLVQIGAYRIRVEAEKALGAWRDDGVRFAGVAAPTLVTADLGEKGVFYRIRIAGFIDSRKAGDFCALYKGPGRDCFVVP